MDCIFCKIISGQIPASKYYEDESAIAFLDLHPVKSGHSLVIPKKHSSYLFEMEDEEYSKLLKSAKNVAKILKKVFYPRSGKIGSIVYGMDIDHVHIHLIPIDQPGDLSLGKAHNASAEELVLTLEKIKEVAKDIA